MKKLIKRLVKIQKDFKCEKKHLNKKGNYKYRKAEDILEAIKPFLDDETAIFLSDDIISLSGKSYVQTTVTFYHDGETLEVKGVAREGDMKLNMDGPQETGSSATYSAKRALGNLFLLDDTQDPDTNEYQNELDASNQQNNNRNNNINNNQNINNNNQQSGKDDWHTNTLRNLIGSITSNFKDKTRVNIICQSLNVRDLSVLAGYNNKKKKEIINYLKKNFK
jgi:membrane-bound inhibitor of C-type lysozyme